MTPARVKTSGLGFGIVASVCFGTSGAFGKVLINAGLAPMQASWIRVAGAAFVLVPLVLALRGRSVVRTVVRNGPMLAAYGAFGLAGCQSFYFIAASRLPVGVAILLEFMGPVLVVAWIRFVRRVAVPRSAVIGVGIAVVGVSCVVEVWSGLSLGVVGVLAGLGAAACQAAYFLLVERANGTIDSLLLTAAGTLVGAVILSVFAAPWTIPWHVLGSTVTFGDHAAPGWVIAAWIIIVSTVVAYLTGVVAVHRLSAPVAGGVAYVEAVSAAVFAWATLGERLTAIQLAGGAIVLIGAFVAQRSVSTEEVPAEARGEVVTAAR